MDVPPVRYRSPEEDSGRWSNFEFQDGDIVISTRSKSGTTWMQMICALLIFQTPELPRPLADISPWLDWLVTPESDVFERLARQDHRRVIKTHTPLDGLPLDDNATFIVVARHPLDAAVSLYHQGLNLDRERVRKLTGAPKPSGGETTPVALEEWLRSWIALEAEPHQALDSLAGFFHHLDDAWQRRHPGDDRAAGNVVLVHFEDLLADLPGEMGTLARTLGIEVDPDLLVTLATAAGFEHMRAIADDTVPDPHGVLRSRRAFFRRGTSGAGREALAPADLRAYHQRAENLAPPELLAWLHRDNEM